MSDIFRNKTIINMAQLEKYYVTYNTKSGDSCTVWVMALSESDAKVEVIHEYWDVDTIIDVQKA